GQARGLFTTETRGRGVWEYGSVGVWEWGSGRVGAGREGANRGNARRARGRPCGRRGGFVLAADSRFCTLIRGAEHAQPRIGTAETGGTIADPRNAAGAGERG